MLKWVVVLIVATIALSLFSRHLRKWGLGRLPGDLHFTRKGREFSIPITSTVLVSLVLTLLTRIL